MRNLSPYTKRCPYCETICDAKWLQVIIFYHQSGPFKCKECGAVEIFPKDRKDFTSEEKKITVG